MADAPFRRRPDRPVAKAFSLSTEKIPPTGQRRDTINDALRLLATWAVRAARAQAQVHLDFVPPESDECSPNPSPGDDVTWPSRERE
jgi:hypothetical protein